MTHLHHQLHERSSTLDCLTPQNATAVTGRRQSLTSTSREIHSYHPLSFSDVNQHDFVTHDETQRNRIRNYTPSVQRLTRIPLRMTTNLNCSSKARSLSPQRSEYTSTLEDKIAYFCKGDTNTLVGDKLVSPYSVITCNSTERNMLPLHPYTPLQHYTTNKNINTKIDKTNTLLLSKPSVGATSKELDLCKQHPTESLRSVKTSTVGLELMTRTKSMPVTSVSPEILTLSVPRSSELSSRAPLPHVQEFKRHCESNPSKKVKVVYNSNMAIPHNPNKGNTDKNVVLQDKIKLENSELQGQERLSDAKLFVVATMEKSGSVFEEMARQLVASGKWTQVTVVPRSLSKTLFVKEYKANLSEVDVNLFLGDKNSCELVISSRRALLRHDFCTCSSYSRTTSSASSICNKFNIKPPIVSNIKNRSNNNNNNSNYCNNLLTTQHSQEANTKSSVWQKYGMLDNVNNNHQISGPYWKTPSRQEKYASAERSTNLPQALPYKSTWLTKQEKEQRQRRRVPMGDGHDNRVRLVDFVESSRCITLKSRMVSTLLEYHKHNWNVLHKYVPLTFYILPRQPFKDERNKLWSQVKEKQNSSWAITSEQSESTSLWIAKSSAGCHGTNVQIFAGDANGIRKMLHFIDSQSNGYSWVVQEYIDRPLLYHKRKFDIRCWVLLILDGYKVYIHDELVMRTSSLPYNRNSATANSHDAKLTHITNHCIQSESKTYSLYERGNELWKEHLDGLISYKAKKLNKNILSKNTRKSIGCKQEQREQEEEEFLEHEKEQEKQNERAILSKWLHEQKQKTVHECEHSTNVDFPSKVFTRQEINSTYYNHSVYTTNSRTSTSSLQTLIIPQIHHIVRDTMLALRQYVPNEVKSRHTYCFQLFGYDFLIDETLKVWLLEINGAPAAAERLLPQIVKDMIELTVLPFYPETFPVADHDPNGSGEIAECNSSSNSLTSSSLEHNDKLCKTSKNGFLQLYPFDGYKDDKPLYYEKQ